MRKLEGSHLQATVAAWEIEHLRPRAKLVLLAWADGALDIETLAFRVGMTRKKALRVLNELERTGVLDLVQRDARLV